MVEQPQMKRGSDRKAELISELRSSRAELAHSFVQARDDLNVAAHLKESIVHKKTAWFAGAAVVGWVLSRFTRRKNSRPALEEPRKRSWFKKNERAGFLLVTLKLLFNMLKPTLTQLATRKITELSTMERLGRHRPY